MPAVSRLESRKRMQILRANNAYRNNEQTQITESRANHSLDQEKSLL